MLFSASCNSFLWLSASQIFSIWCSFWIIFGSSFHCRDRSVKCSPSFLTVLVDIDQSLHSDVWISNHIRRQNGWTMMNYVIMFVTLCHIMSLCSLQVAGQSDCVPTARCKHVWTGVVRFVHNLYAWPLLAIWCVRVCVFTIWYYMYIRL